ncbi:MULTISPECIES: NUDIX domain-containing protein [unclassified Frankia]|uniref:NUDIX hydrolase n=1 Tax=unclassified Frankia TaxID=2632575 RepID=UPI002AD56768|nr:MULTISPECIES: NUDIX domain-containing protein [unclassified Frankia]
MSDRKQKTEPSRVDYWDDPAAPRPTSRKASASAFVRNDTGGVLLLRRPDNGLWTIPTGGVKKNETVAAAAVRETREETGLDIDITGLVGIFSDPRHVIRYSDGEVRQPINICFRAIPTGGNLTTTDEASEVLWVEPADIAGFTIHPAIMLRLNHALTATDPYLG